MTRTNHGIAHKLRATLSLLVVLSLTLATLSIPQSQHWCGKFLFSQSLYGTAKSCGMEDEKPTGLSLSEPDCCHNELHLLAAKGMQHDGVQVAWRLSQPVQAIFPVNLIIGEEISVPHAILGTPYPLGSPPGPQRDVVVEQHAYLI